MLPKADFIIHFELETLLNKPAKLCNSFFRKIILNKNTGFYFHQQAFIQALLCTEVSPQRFNFFTICLVQWLRGVGWAHGRHRRENFWNLDLQIAGKCFFFDFSWNFRVSWGVLKKREVERYIQLSFMHACKYLNQRVTSRHLPAQS